MKTYAVYLKPRGALATWPLASDTLFGAVCWGIRTLGLMDDRQLTDWLEAQKTAPVFAFSHAFPMYKTDKTLVRLFPRPATFHPDFNDFHILAVEWQKKFKGSTLKTAQAEVAVAGKKFKRLAYVSEGVLTQICTGGLAPIDGLRSILFGSGQISARAGSLCTSSEAQAMPEKLYQSEAVQHNQIDRMGGATVDGMLFYRDEIFFAPGAGLWSALCMGESDFVKYVKPALNYLSDTGFGADRSVGKGQFEITIESIPQLPRAKSPKAMMALSHYLPEVGEIDPSLEPLAYTLKTLRPKREQKFPRFGNNQKSAMIYKQEIRVFEPGSVFALKVKKEIYGKLARLTPPDQEVIFQSGAAIMVYL